MSSEDVNVKFGEEYDRENLDNTDNNEKEDLSKYTVIDGDNLDEDEPIKGQEYCIFSFMSPEGIMNCNVRAVKFRGAFGSLEEAEKYAGELEKKDKYFKIFCGESGKWLDFDPPLSRVEREKSSNPEHQKILDETSKHRMNKINELAGKHKELMDKKTSGKKERIEETKKAGAADEIVDRERSKKLGKSRQEKTNKHDRRSVQDMRQKMRERLAQRQKDKNANKEKDNEDNEQLEADDQLENKIKVVKKASDSLAKKKDKLDEATKNIEKIKELMNKRKQNN
jgi:hypothetical protein